MAHQPGRSAVPPPAVAPTSSKDPEAFPEPQYGTGKTLEAIGYLLAGAGSFGLIQKNTPRLLKLGVKMAGGSSGYVVGHQWARRLLPEAVEKALKAVDVLKSDAVRKLVVSILLDVLITAIMLRRLPLVQAGVEVVLGEDGWEAARAFLMNVLYGPIINCWSLLTGAMPFLTPYVPVLTLGWAMENQIITPDKIEQLLPDQAKQGLEKLDKLNAARDEFKESPVKAIVKFLFGYAKKRHAKKKASQKTS